MILFGISVNVILTFEALEDMAIYFDERSGENDITQALVWLV